MDIQRHKAHLFKNINTLVHIRAGRIIQRNCREQEIIQEGNRSTINISTRMK